MKYPMKKNQEEHNPCLREQLLTYKCFNANNFEKEACELEIQNHKVCKGFWNSVQSERRKRGIKPYLPPVEERAQIKKEYFEKLERDL